MKNMRSYNSLYPDTYGKEVTEYKFTKEIFNNVKIDRNNIIFQHPISFINMIKEDEAVCMTQYHRYHDYILSDGKNTDFTKMIKMYNIYWELNKECLSVTNNISGIFKRQYKSINCVLINHFESNDNKNFSSEYIKNLIYRELVNELYLRIEWEESRTLDVIKTIKSQNKEFDINTWMYKYINHENESRYRWYDFIIKIIKMSLKKIKEFVDDETVKIINDIDMNEISIPISSYEIYDKDKYDYLFSINLNKIQLIDGLWKIVENGNIITTANVSEDHEDSISFKRVAIIPEPVCVGKFESCTNNFVNINNVQHNIPMKKNLQRRKKQMIDKFGYDVERSFLEIKQIRKTTTDMILADLYKRDEITVEVKSIREQNRDKYFANLSKNKTSVDNTNVYVSKYTGTCTNKNKYASSSKNTSYNTKQSTVSHTKIKCEKDDTRRDKIFSDKIFDIPPYMDMTKYEVVSQDEMNEFKNNFIFNTVYSLGKYYMMSTTINTILNYYERCNKKYKTMKEYLSELYNKISFDDMKNKTSNLQTIFKDGKIDADICKHQMFIM